MSKKVDTNEVLVDLGGEPIVRENEDGTEEMTLGLVLVNALLHPKNEDDKTSGDTKLARFNLAQAIYAAGEPIEIGNSDIAMLKKLVNNVYPALYVGQVYKILDRG